MRILISIALAAILSACGVLPSSKVNPRVEVVDRSGAPVQGAIVRPEPEDPRDAETPTRELKSDLAERTTDAQGRIRADLEDYFWGTDSCYHFRVHRDGFEDFEISVSRDLMPAVFRIELRDAAEPSR